MNLRTIQTCRVCGSSALTPVIDLGEQHLQGSFAKPGVQMPPMRRIPCQLVRCNPQLDENACGLLQMRHSVPPQILYSSYWYRSGTNQTMRDHLADIAAEATKMIGGEHGSALDIGCNDCTLLKQYPQSWQRYGIDPSYIEHSDLSGITVIKSLFPSDQLRAKQFDVITSIAMFYDLEDPCGFAMAVKRSLAIGGIWILEMSYMPTMLDRNAYDTICHEHLEYYSLAVIEYICASAGLKVCRAELNEINGGSVRCYVAHAAEDGFDKPEWTAAIQRIRCDEFDRTLDTDAPYVKFQRHVQQHREDLLKLLAGLWADRKRVHIYGASTKGNTLLQWCGIDSKIIECAADRNPQKHGARTLGTDIPIVSEEESRAMRPDYLLVLPWHFRDEFVKREAEFVARGGKFIFPLPEITIV